MFADCLQESSYQPCQEGTLVLWPVFLRLLQRQCVPIDQDTEYIEEYTYYQFLIQAVSTFYQQHSETVRQQVASQIEDSSFFAFGDTSNAQFFPECDAWALQQQIFLKVMQQNILSQYVESLAKESSSEMPFILKTVSKNELTQNLKRYIKDLLFNCK